MKKILTTSLTTGAVLTAALPAFAQINTCPPGSFSSLCLTSNNLGQVVGQTISFVFVVATVAALLYLIWGGIRWILSKGEKGGVEEAQKHIVAAIIGLVVIFLSFLILNVVVHFFLPGLDLTHLVLPNL